MTSAGYTHPPEVRKHLSDRGKAFYAANPGAGAIRGARMRAAKKGRVTRRCVWCADEFLSYHSKNVACEPCRPIDRLEGWLRRTYKIGFHEFQELFIAQGGECAICQGSGRKKGARRIHVDHDHDSGVVRGLLCSDCNLVLGKMQDRSDLLRAAAEYLEKNTNMEGKQQ